MKSELNTFQLSPSNTTLTVLGTKSDDLSSMSDKNGKYLTNFFS